MTIRTSMLALAVALAALQPLGAAAQTRCDCSTILGSCAAQITATERWLDVTTDTPQCARVDYLVDGLPFVTTVLDGQSRVDRSNPQARPSIRLQSCRICADTGAASAAGSARPSTAEEGPLQPLLRWNPEYPAQALVDGVEGYATVAFDVNAQGTVENASALESEPGDVFDAAALEAVRRWRYAPAADRPVTRLTERVEFSLADMIWQLQPGAGGAADEPVAGLPANRCVREDAVYNFGELVEAALINACADPLLVYGCAAGVGRQTGRWACTDSERTETMLVRPGDPRTGTSAQLGETASAAQWFAYRENFFVVRAPNSQYWWIACRPADSGCRADAQMWIRAMDAQPVSVDPRGRASIAVARSY